MHVFYLISSYFRENRVGIAAGLFCLIMVDVLQLFIPRVLKQAVDGLASMNVDSRALFGYALTIVGIAAAIGALRYGWRLLLMGLSRRIEEGLRNRLFNHIQELDASYFDRTAAGDLMAHATNDIQNVRMAAGMGIVALTDAVVLGTAAIGFMAYIHVRLTLFVLLPMPFIVLSTKFFSKRMHRLYQKSQEVFSEMTEMIRERFSGIRIVKAYTLEARDAKDIHSVSNRYVSTNLALARLIQSFFPLMLFFANLSLVLVLFLGGRQAIEFAITPGDFVAFISYLGLLTWPMMALGWVANLIQRGKSSLERIEKILKTEPEIVPAKSMMASYPFESALTFEDVSFSHAGKNDRSAFPIQDLIHIDLEIPQGTILGIVGPPGSGKTTLIELIPRLYDATQGTIRMGGIDIRDMHPEFLRSCMVFMPQEAFLFADTLRQNITLGRPGITANRLREALHRSALDQTIHDFPHELDTMVGERGIILSGGQKQRVALARALLSEAPILILDDPISQVDIATGHRILQSLYSLPGEKTIIIVSHRLAAVRRATKIIVMDQGRIAASGTHEELLLSNAYYRRTHQLQSIEETYHEQ